MTLEADEAAPRGEIALRTRAMPADTNPSGDIFGGWIMSQMDLSGATYALQRAHGRVATIAVEGMTFHKPVFVGDEVTCYCDLVRVGNTSIAVQVEVWVRRDGMGKPTKVTSACFTFVAIDENRKPRLVPHEGA